MRFASCLHGDRRFAGVVRDDHVVPIEGVDELGGSTPIELLADPPLLEQDAVALADVVLRPVIPRPGKIVCVGLNYLAHVGETGREVPEYPVLFTKFASSLLGAHDDIALPPESAQVDWEGELAVVIGRAGRRIPREAALEHVAGYTVANDVTMRDYQYKTHQWLQGKAWERSTPLGPHLVTPEEVGDPGRLALWLEIDGERLQEASTEQLMFDVPTLIAHLSEFVSLEPGDVILTGTPGGVGFRREPQRFLQPGEEVRVCVEGLGTLANRVVAERP